MKLVILDGYAENPGDLRWDALRRFGELTVYDRTNPGNAEEIARRIGGAEIVITNKTPVSREVFDACKNIRLVAVLATGYNIVDAAYAKQRGIPVCNVPAYGTDAVAQYAIALLLEICSQVGHHSAAVRAGRWSEGPDFCFWDTPLIELSGKTMGIIGFGRIGRAVGRIARAMGMRVLACGSRPTEEGREIAGYVGLPELLRQADVVSLHCPLTPQTEKIINRETLSMMKPGAILLNNARGALLDEQAVADALNEGQLYAAGVDVASTEPISSDNPLLTAKNCFITPHISWACKECRERILQTTIENIAALLAGSPANVVNP